jgi:1-deoxy-D-xylulose-5-phosphate reductoisomerase
MRSITLLGATGSIGASTLDVVARHPDRYRVFALSARNSVEPLLEQCRKYRPRIAVLSGVAEDRSLRRRFAESAGCELRFGAPALEEVASHPDCDSVMAAIVGAAGLAAAIAAARSGKRVLLANKEALVMAGAVFMSAVRDSGALLLPVDSEHNAVFQCMAQQGPARGSSSVGACS